MISPRTNRLRSGLALAVTGTVVVGLATGPAAAQVADDGHRASAVGTVVHAEGIEQPPLSEGGSVRVIDADAAFSSAAHDGDGLPDQQTTEFGGTFQPAETADGAAVAGMNAYGRGYGLDVSLGQEGQQDGQLTLAGLSEAVAPPPSDLVVNEIGPVPADPLAYATTLRGEAEATYFGDGACPALGADLAYGRGLAADLQLIDTDAAPDAEGEEPTLETPVLRASADDSDRTVSSSLSHTFLAPQTNAEGDVVGADLAVLAETRQTIAPVTLFSGTPNEVTIELLGEWVLRAVATGVPGSARVEYGPGEVSPETPVLRILQADSTETLLTTQDLFGEEGLSLPALPLLELTVGEDPRAIGGGQDTAPEIADDGTRAAAAVDVLRLRVLSDAGLGEAVELRLGHMEVIAEAPPGGVSCDLPISKASDPVEVLPGDTFTHTITVDNPFQCDLTNVRIEDRISATDGVTWTVDGADPEPASLSDSEVVWEGLGPIAPGEQLSVTITVTVGDDSEAGHFTDEATATARCEGGPVDANTSVDTAVDLDGSTVLEAPEVGERDPAVQGGDLAATGGGTFVALTGLAAFGLAAVMRRRR